MNDAEIGSTYRRLEKTKKQLRKREHDGKLIVDNLRVLADCFDPEEQNSTVREFKDGVLYVWDEQSKEIDLPLEAEQIAKDICELTRQLKELEERLRLLVDCA